MGFFDFFKKPVAFQIEQKINVVSSYVNPEYEKSRALMKEATAVADTDITAALLLLEEAIKICPENADYFKLANYYHKAGQKDKAYSILEKMLSELNLKDIGMYHMHTSIIYEKLCTLTYKDTQFDKYLFYYACWLHDRIVSMACQGRIEELNCFITDKDKLDHLAPTKVKGSFKKLSKVSIMEEFNKGLNQYFESNAKILQDMARKSCQENSKNDIDSFRMGESVGDRANRILSKNDNFVSSYNRFITSEFKDYFNRELRPLIT